MSDRCTVWILGDQLLAQHPALEVAEGEFAKDGIHVLLIESQKRLTRRTYHAKKLVLLLSAMRHYAKRLASEGYQIEYVKAKTSRDGLEAQIQRIKPTRLFTMAASEYGGRQFQNVLSRKFELPVTIVENKQFLTGRFNPIPDPEIGKHYRMEYFYRSMRKNFKLLMDGEEPLGGKWNFDKENRKPLPKSIQPPDLPEFKPNKITQEVIEEVDRFDNLIGATVPFSLAVTHEQADFAFEDFLHQRLPNFGPYEDAMSQRHPSLFHSMISPYINLGLLEPMDLVKRAEAIYCQGLAPINSVEGFIRQIIGWREFIYWQYHRSMPEYLEHNFWQAKRHLPSMYWTAETDMNCMQTVLTRTRETGYAHHIERLMVLSNFALLAKVNPLEVNDWFLSSFIDAYEWVMAPNVIGMGLFADGGLLGTKPYIASANYINKMSDYCKNCRFNAKKRIGKDACPFNKLYWTFLLEKEETLRANPRMGPNVLGLRYLSQEEKEQIPIEAEILLRESR